MNLEPTGERVIEAYRGTSRHSYLIYLFHIVTYDFVRPFVRGKRVLDLGCGSGYGAARIAEDCERIVGVDVAPDAVAHARAHFRRDNLEYRAIAPVEEQPLPFPDASFDVVLSFQVIEHVRSEAAYLAEARRVLRPGGRFIVATPDRSSRLLPAQKPWNRWHLREYSAATLGRLLATHFPSVEMKMMGGRAEVIGIETGRTRRLRWLLLPLTLPFVPEKLRVAGLGLVRWLSERLPRRKPAAAPDGGPAFGFGPQDLSISEHEEPSVNLIAVAKLAAAEAAR